MSTATSSELALLKWLGLGILFSLVHFAPLYAAFGAAIIHEDERIGSVAIALGAPVSLVTFWPLAWLSDYASFVLPLNSLLWGGGFAYWLALRSARSRTGIAQPT